MAMHSRHSALSTGPWQLLGCLGFLAAEDTPSAHKALSNQVLESTLLGQILSDASLPTWAWGELQAAPPFPQELSKEMLGHPN